MLYIILAVIIGAVVLFFALAAQDEERRAKGRGRLNDILTDFGGGSFQEKVESKVSEVKFGCLQKILFWSGLVVVFALLEKGCK